MTTTGPKILVIDDNRVVLAAMEGALTGAGYEVATAETGEDGDKAASAFEGAPVAIVVVGVPKTSDKIPAIEQTLSAGCAAYNVLSAALASGWGANWLTGWISRDRVLLEGTFGLTPGEWIAAFVHVGSCGTSVPERPRPDMAKITTWVGE